jgi:hypothetical protein
MNVGSQTLVSEGPLTATLQCIDNAGTIEPEVWITSTADLWASTEDYPTMLTSADTSVRALFDDFGIGEVVATEPGGSFVWVYATAMTNTYGSECVVVGYYLTGSI